MMEKSFVPAEVVEFRKKIGKNLKIIRKSLNLTQEELAEKHGVPVSQVSRLEAGKARTMDFIFLFELSRKPDIMIKIFDQDMSADIYKYICS